MYIAKLTFLEAGEVEWEVFVQCQCEITAHLKGINIRHAFVHEYSNQHTFLKN